MVQQPATETLRMVLQQDARMVVWWGTRVECMSAFARSSREEVLDAPGETAARDLLKLLANKWSEIQPTDHLRVLAERLLSVHALRASDGLQLASALVWCDSSPEGRAFVCLDGRLRKAAYAEGFMVQPDE